MPCATSPYSRALSGPSDDRSEPRSGASQRRQTTILAAAHPDACAVIDTDVGDRRAAAERMDPRSRQTSSANPRNRPRSRPGGTHQRRHPRTPREPARGEHRDQARHVRPAWPPNPELSLPNPGAPLADLVEASPVGHEVAGRSPRSRLVAGAAPADVSGRVALRWRTSRHHRGHADRVDYLVSRRCHGDGPRPTSAWVRPPVEVGHARRPPSGPQ